MGGTSYSAIHCWVFIYSAVPKMELITLISDVDDTKIKKIYTGVWLAEILFG